MDPAKPRILVLSKGGSEALISSLEQCGAKVHHARTAAQVIAVGDRKFFHALFVEVTTADDVSSLLSFREHWPDLSVLAFGSAPEAGVALEVLRAGALEYLSWPINEPSVDRALQTALEHGSRNAMLRRSSLPQFGLLGASPQILTVREAIARVAAGTASVFVRGETGTGKELVARAIHAQSPRYAAPFVKVHAPGLPDALLESELFGYEKGAFTGATTRKPGRVELAEGGTLFLDEIAEMSPTMQAKLLRLIQDREYERLGGTRTLQADLRFVTATHRDVEHMIDSGAFREDLFYRLNVVTIWLPPLRARRDDILLIARHYLERFRDANRKPALHLDDRAERLLHAQRWPGNVRQLVNFMERLVVMARTDVISADDVRREFDEQAAFTTQSVLRESTLPAVQSEASSATIDPSAVVPAAELDFSVLRSSTESSNTVGSLREEVRRAERRALERALRVTDGNRTKAAQLLEVSRTTLYSKLEEHGID
jgi:two-component system, NtrC family, response regulator AtoC